jgi:hypothetical protein
MTHAVETNNYDSFLVHMRFKVIDQTHTNFVSREFADPKTSPPVQSL